MIESSLRPRSLVLATVLLVATSTSAHAGWVGPREHTDDMTDVSRTVIWIETDNAWKGVFGREERGTLFVRCQNNKTEAWFDAGQVVESNYRTGSSPVVYRLDDEKAVTTSWSGSDSKKAVFIPKPIGFLRKMVGHSKLRIRIKWAFATDSPTWTGTITLPDDTKDKVQAIATECNWKL